MGMSVPAVALSTDGHACLQCGYALTGLASPGPCPECGHPISDSIRGIGLRYATPELIETIRAGLNDLAVVFGLFWARALYDVYLLVDRDPIITRSVLSVLLALCATPLILRGSWRLTVADPRIRAVDPTRRVRWFVRFSAWSVCLVWFVGTLGWRWMSMRGGSYALDVVVTFAGLGIMLWIAPLGLYLSALARRSERSTLSRWCRILALAVPVTLVLMPTLAIAKMVSLQPPSRLSSQLAFGYFARSGVELIAYGVLILGIRMTSITLRRLSFGR